MDVYAREGGRGDKAGGDGQLKLEEGTGVKCLDVFGLKSGRKLSGLLGMRVALRGLYSLRQVGRRQSDMPLSYMVLGVLVTMRLVMS